ncbi:hypothetical protein PV05_01550 [Exophiala xenobiotica]|uniref:F-box domain-containing protein n=1 Tax=Exophiala xenobiotica TaxID=348802 RepID=A0A0D2FMV7_9EURO|nr:uncharacterized protein PV05_01550 [Exophiala xenobiotica]KIW61429.1 hypothetical protein PV05_01550 [Exophiala xenobiotica]
MSIPSLPVEILYMVVHQIINDLYPDADRGTGHRRLLNPPQSARHYAVLTRAAARSMDLMFKALLQCLCLVQPRLESIYFNGDFKETFTRDWVESWWDNLRLDYLTALYFDGIPFNNEGYIEAEDRQERIENAQTALAAWLEKSHSTLQSLELDRTQGEHERMTWRSISRLEFPELRWLELTGISISPALLAGDLKCLPRLQEVLLEDCYTEGGSSAWKVFFDTIREHSNKVRLVPKDIDPVDDHFQEDMMWSFASDGMGPRKDQTQNPLSAALDKELALYLSDQGRWTQSMEDFFADF